jgi:hypothetical protein
VKKNKAFVTQEDEYFKILANKPDDPKLRTRTQRSQVVLSITMNFKFVYSECEFNLSYGLSHVFDILRWSAEERANAKNFPADHPRNVYNLAIDFDDSHFREFREETKMITTGNEGDITPKAGDVTPTGSKPNHLLHKMMLRNDTA